MGFLDKFEKGVENVTNRAMSRFSDDIEPIEIASKLRETMDKRAASFARDRSVVPNIFRIHLTPPSIERITAWGQDEMVRQMEEVATSHAADQGYSFVGPVEVSFLVNNNPNAPAIEIESSTRRGAAAPAASATATPIGATDTIEDVPGSVRNSCTHRCAYGLPRFRGIVIHLGVQARCVIAALLVELIKNRVGSSFTLLIVLGLKRSDIGAPRDLNCTRARSDRRILDGHLLVRVTQVLETFRHQHRAQGTTAVHQGRHLVAQRDVVSLRGGDITHVEIRITHKIRHPAACAFLGLRLPRTLVGSEV